MPESLHITEEEYESLANKIASDESVVGIDAKKTHILILHLLIKMQQKIEHLERTIESLSNGNK